MSRCPGRDRFELFLAERLDDRSREELERHVESCSACQELLDALTGVADWVSLRRPATAAGAAADAEGFLRRLRESPPGAGEPLATRRDPRGGVESEGRGSPARGWVPDRTESRGSRSGPVPIDVAITLVAAPSPDADLVASTQVGTAVAPRASI